MPETDDAIAALVATAQERDHDPGGDPDAEDPGACEPPSDIDPPPTLPPDAADQFDDLPLGEDLGPDWHEKETD